MGLKFDAGDNYEFDPKFQLILSLLDLLPRMTSLVRYSLHTQDYLIIYFWYINSWVKGFELLMVLLKTSRYANWVIRFLVKHWESCKIEREIGEKNVEAKQDLMWHDLRIFFFF